MENLDPSRMMHGHYGYGLDMQQQQQQHLQQQQPSGSSVDGARGHADISSILDQIMNITDQSLDEAQVYLVFEWVGSDLP